MFSRVSHVGTFLWLAHLVSGCANMSSLQTAQTLPPGDHQFVMGGGYFTMPELSQELSETTEGEDVVLRAAYAEFMYRHGIAENFDAGIKLTLIGTLALDGKYRFVNAGGFAMATGVSVGYLRLESTEGTNGDVTNIVDVTVPLHMSFDLGESAAIYLSPKYNLRSADGIIHLGGGTFGVRLGADIGLYLEVSYVVDLEDLKAPGIMQVNTAFYF